MSVSRRNPASRHPAVRAGGLRRNHEDRFAGGHGHAMHVTPCCAQRGTRHGVRIHGAKVLRSTATVPVRTAMWRHACAGPTEIPATLYSWRCAVGGVGRRQGPQAMGACAPRSRSASARHVWLECRSQVAGPQRVDRSDGAGRMTRSGGVDAVSLPRPLPAQQHPRQQHRCRYGFR